MADPRRNSRILLEGHRAPARAMMKGAGFTDDDLARPQIGVAHWAPQAWPACTWRGAAWRSSSR